MSILLRSDPKFGSVRPSVGVGVLVTMERTTLDGSSLGWCGPRRKVWCQGVPRGVGEVGRGSHLTLLEEKSPTSLRVPQVGDRLRLFSSRTPTCLRDSAGILPAGRSFGGSLVLPSTTLRSYTRPSSPGWSPILPIPTPNSTTSGELGPGAG